MGGSPVVENASQERLQSSSEPEFLGPGEREKHGQQRAGQDDDMRHARFSLVDNAAVMETQGSHAAGSPTARIGVEPGLNQAEASSP
jgi:hypothetical protein